MEETKYMTLIREKYTPPDDASYEEDAIFLWLLNGPPQCHVEDEMLEYMSNHPEADAKELSVFFFSLFPDGIPEEYQDWDDDEDDE